MDTSNRKSGPSLHTLRLTTTSPKLIRNHTQALKYQYGHRLLNPLRLI